MKALSRSRLEKERRSRPQWSTVWVTLCAALTVLVASSSLFGGTTAQAHVAVNGAWYWAAASRDVNNVHKELDPIDILWAPGSTYNSMTTSVVEDEVEREWRRRPSHGQMNHGQVCLGQGQIARLVGDGRQRMVFFSDNGSGDRTPTTTFQESTSNKCKTQYHMRFWTDVTHAQITQNHGSSGQWSLSGVHRDISTCTHVNGNYGGCHKISGHWAHYRNYAINRAMRSMCGRARWRMFPGADRKFQGHSHDGYIGIVKGQSSNCPNGLY